MVLSLRGDYLIRRLTHPDDPDLELTAALLRAVFPDPNTVLGLDRLREFLSRPGRDRVFNVLAAKDADVVIGCTVFSYVPASNCGFSEYIAVSKETRGGGLGRRLFEARRGLLDELAISRGHTGCDGLFIEADNPHRMPTDFRERERATAIDADERLRIFAHLGFKRVDAVYVQPPLGYEKQAVSYMDLLFAPWRSAVDSIDATTVLLTVEPIWRAWSPDTCAVELNALRARLTRPMVALKSLLSQPERR